MQKEKRGKVGGWRGVGELKEDSPIPWCWWVHPEGLLNHHVQVVQLLYGIVHGSILPERRWGGDEGESEGVRGDEGESEGRMMTDSLSKPDPHTRRGSGTKSMVQFCPAATMSAVPIRSQNK